MKTFGIIGTGNMGYPILCGAVRAFGKENVSFLEVNEQRKSFVSTETGVEAKASVSELLSSCKMVLLAVKPQYLKKLLNEMEPDITSKHIILTIAAGVPMTLLQESFGKDTKLVRAMPNTPAMVSEGMTGVCFSEAFFSAEEKELVHRLFSSFGKYELVPEALMNAVTCACGSSPAYVYMMIEALADGVVKYGIPREQAYRMVAQTVYGSAKMLMETGKHPGELKDQVCSPSGTTIAAVSALEEAGFRSALIKACDACYTRSIK